MKIFLDENELLSLYRQKSETRRDGGFQSLLVKLQEKVNRHNGEIDLTPELIERIYRYAFSYGNGGWESRLKSIFGRHLFN